MNIADLIASHGLNRPRDPALVHGPVTLSCAEVARRTVAFAARLHEAGVTPGSIVGLCLGDSADHLILHFAVARLGAVILPMDHRWTDVEKDDVARAFGAAFVILEPGDRRVPAVSCLEIDATWADAPAGALPPPPRNRDQTLLISLSSGTTGRPKGAVVTHGQMYERFVNQWVTLGLNATDRFISVTPLYFGAARSFCMSVLAAGAQVVLDPPPHKPGQLAAAINASHATVCFMVPTLMRRLLAECPDGAPLLLPELRLLIFGGSIVASEEAARIRERLTPHLASYYATSEGGGISVLRPAEFASHGDTVGRATFRVDVEVVDGADQPVPAGDVGRLRFRGPGVATGFLDEHGQVQHGPAGGWFYPGDLASIDATSYISLRGREKEMIIRGGINVYPAEIERVLCEHPAVREAGVVAWPSAAHGEEIAAFVATTSAVDAGELLAWCRSRLAPYKIPREILFLPELPKTNFGKVRKSDLTALLPPRQDRR
jgi:acyl-CoA synthetase (AMP-forming)/AMP-acid ligase II